jgi:hypothetical protein
MDKDLFRMDLDKIKYEDIEQFTGISESKDKRPKENDFLDFNIEIPSDLGDAVTAFSNTYGGLIILGVKASKEDQNIPVEIPGIFKTPDIKSNVINRIMSTVYPRPALSIGVADHRDFPDRVVIVVRVVESRVTPHMFTQGHQNKISVRIGDQNRYASLQQIEGLFAKIEKLSSKDAAFQQLSDLYIVNESGSRIHHHQKISVIPVDDLNIRLDRVSELEFEKVVRKEFYHDRRYISDEQRHARYYQIEHRKDGEYYHRIWRLYSSGMIEFISQIGKGAPKQENLGDMIVDVISILQAYRSLLEQKAYFGKSYFRHEISIVDEIKLLTKMRFFCDKDSYDNMEGIRLERDTVNSNTYPSQHIVDRYLDFSDIKTPDQTITESFLEHLRMIFQASVNFDKLLEQVIWLRDRRQKEFW